MLQRRRIESVPQQRHFPSAIAVDLLFAVRPEAGRLHTTTENFGRIFREAGLENIDL